MDFYRDIDEKIVRVLNGTATDLERQEVRNWIGESKSNFFQFDHLKKIWNETSTDLRLIGHEDQKRHIWNTFLEEDHRYKKAVVKPRGKRTLFKVAAIIVILVVPLYMFLYSTEDRVVETEPEWVVVNKRNPAGQKSLIQLPDGTKVWLNSDSQISYMEAFSDSVRSVKLDGEAYFEVVPDSLRPFKVEVGSLSVRVLGTAFNVNAFEEEQEVKVALVEGLVQVTDLQEDLILRPGTGMIYSKENKRYREFSTLSHPGFFSKAIGWRNGVLVFDGTDFSGFVREITRWYGVRVEVEGSPTANWNIRATFENELLTYLLDAVSYNKGFRYRLKDKELTIMFHD